MTDTEARQRARRIVQERGLGALANDTKWREFFDQMQARRIPVEVKLLHEDSPFQTACIWSPSENYIEGSGGIGPVLFAPGRGFSLIAERIEALPHGHGNAATCTLQMVRGHVLRGLIHGIDRGGEVHCAPSALSQVQIRAMLAAQSHLTRIGSALATLDAVIHICGCRGKEFHLLPHQNLKLG